VILSAKSLAKSARSVILSAASVVKSATSVVNQCEQRRKKCNERDRECGRRVESAIRLSVRDIYTSAGSVHRTSAGSAYHVFCVDISISVNSPWPLNDTELFRLASGIWSLASPAKPA